MFSESDNQDFGQLLGSQPFQENPKFKAPSPDQSEVERSKSRVPRTLDSTWDPGLGTQDLIHQTLDLGCSHNSGPQAADMSLWLDEGYIIFGVANSPGKDEVFDRRETEASH